MTRGLLCVFTAAAVLASGCAATGDDKQEAAVAANMASMPKAALDALHAGDVKTHYTNEFGHDVDAERPIRLDVGTPDTRGTEASGVAACRAVVKALAPTTARMYGSFGRGADLYEATDTTCERGLGAHSWWQDPTGVQPDWLIGVRRGDAVIDTGVSIEIDEMRLRTAGYSWRKTAQQPLTVAHHTDAELDEAVGAASLPWRPGTGGGWQSVAFVVPAGTPLRLTIACGTDWRPAVIRLDSGASGYQLSFEAAPRSSDPLFGRLQPCGGTSDRTLEPVVSYRDAEGEQVDRYSFDYRSPAYGSAPTVTITRD